MDAKSPWARKIRRAEKHLAELKDELRAYESSDRYAAIRDLDTDPNPGVWMYRAKLTDQPNENLPLIIGDIVHNLRASLDHVMAAFAPTKRKRHAKFPIFTEDFWRTNPHTGEHVDRGTVARNARQAYKRDVKDLPREARRIVGMTQPFRASVDSTWLNELHALDIADKHYSLLTVPHGVESPVVEVRIPEQDVRFHLRSLGICPDGEVVALLPNDLQAFPLGHRIIAALAIPDTKVHVELTGTPKVGLEVPGIAGQFHVPEAVEHLIGQVWAVTEMLGWHVPPSKA